jgi:endonuclease/exonuclease/phosphatase family metal-dependent hydrolase
MRSVIIARFLFRKLFRVQIHGRTQSGFLPSDPTVFLFFSLVLLLDLSPVQARFDPFDGSLSKDNPAYIRFLSYNVARQYPSGTSAQVQAVERVLSAVRPDIIAFQEILPTDGAALRNRLQTVLGGTWTIHEGLSDGFIRNVVASRWSQSLQRTDTSPPSSVRGTTLARIDIPPQSAPTPVYVAGIHFKCCPGTTEDSQRQRHADAIAAWFGDARRPGGTITLPSLTPMVCLGDFNFGNNFSPQPRLTLINGTIQNTTTFGPAVRGDWDDTPLQEALPLDPFNLTFQTFSTTNPGSRLDRFYFTDSVATKAQAFILNTATIPTSVRTTLGLQATDTATASDHLPLVVDLALGSTLVTEPTYRGVFLTEIMADPTAVADEFGEWVELYNSTKNPVDLNGWVLSDSGSNFAVLRRNGGLMIQPGQHLVIGLNSNPTVNGGVIVDHVVTNFRLTNNSDAVELYRGSIKVDGVRYGAGPEGLHPENQTVARFVIPGRSWQMAGDYRLGATGQWIWGSELYNSADRGTPGALNFSPQTVVPFSAFPAPQDLLSANPMPTDLTPAEISDWQQYEFSRSEFR